MISGVTLTCINFLRAFIEKYISDDYVNKKKIEFLKLKQNELSMAEQEKQFLKLSKYGPEEVAISERKRKGFEEGVNLKIKERMALTTYKDSIKISFSTEEAVKEGKALEAMKQKTISISTEVISQMRGKVEPILFRERELIFTGKGSTIKGIQALSCLWVLNCSYVLASPEELNNQ